MSEDVLPYGNPDPQPTGPTAVCLSCRAPIVWVTSVKGKKIPCDAKTRAFVPCPRGTVVTDARNGVGLVVAGAGVNLYTPHWATCPYAGQHRKGGTGGT